MVFQPVPNQEVTIELGTYRITEHPSAPGMPYGQEGRRAVVYQLVDQSGDKHALKVFKPRFRVPRLTSVAEKLKIYANLPGLQASERVVFTSSRHLELLRAHPDLTYAVLMPWVEGPTWQEVLLSGTALTKTQSLQIVRSFVNVLVAMEERGLAHCDLSGPNSIITTGNQVAVVDLEEMYGPNFLKPRVVPAGSPGYAHKSAPEGLWREESDRFSGAVLLVEMLGWCDGRMRDISWGESYYDVREMQKESERYKELINVLEENWGQGVTQLFERVWGSERLGDCPTFAEWVLVLPEEVEGEGMELVMETVEVGEKGVGEGAYRLEREDVWYCSQCEQPVLLKLEVCPHCELGSRPKHVVPSAEKETWRCPHCQKALTGEIEVCPNCKKGIDEPVEILITKQKKRIPLWGWVGIGIVIIGLAIAGVGRSRSDTDLLAVLGTGTSIPTNTNPPTVTPKQSNPTKTPTASPFITPKPQKYRPISDCPKSRVHVGDTVFVTFGGTGNAIRSIPKLVPTLKDTIAYADQGDILQIIGGPSCYSGWLLWEVLTIHGDIGWTPETEDGKDFWLEPLYSYKPCSDAPASRLQIGDNAMVVYFPDDPNRVRSKSSKSGEHLGWLYPGDFVEILDGPECGNNMVWWKVRAKTGELIGWTAEGDNSNYWIVLVPKQ